MAEEVQAELDRMVPALNDLQERGVFTKEEIHAIVDRRRLSEYALRRRRPRKADFLRYLQQEMDLEKLRKLRVRKIKREERGKTRPSLDEQDHERSKHIGDQHVVGHLHVLWKRTLRKYKADVDLYLKYAAFCKEIHAQRELSRVYGEALRLHPQKVDLWIEAASHEFFQAGSIQNARVLMQRALRVHPKAENLWLQLFALELHFATKMMGRRKILHGEEEGVDDSQGHDPLAIATLVFQNAVSKLPEEVRFRVRFWDQCRMFPRTEPLKRVIWESIMTECGNNPEAWLAWAIFAWELEKDVKAKAEKSSEDEQQGEDENGEEENEDQKGFLRSESPDKTDSEPIQKKQKGEDGEATEDSFGSENVLSVLGKAVKKIRTEEMFLKAARTANSYIDDLKKRDADDSEIETAVEFLGDILAEASNESFYSANLAVEYAAFLTRCGQKDDAKKCLRDFIRTSDAVDQAHIWVQLAELSIGEAIDVLSEASRHIKVGKREHFQILLRLMGAKMQTEEVSCLSSLFERILLLAPGFNDSLTLEQESFGVNGLADVCVQFLNFTRETDGAEAGRKVYQSILYKSTIAKAMLDADEETTLMLFSAAIDVERLAAKDKKHKSEMRRLYDTIISLLGEESPLADDYRQQKREELANYSNSSKVSIPKLNVQSPSFGASSLTEAFEKFRVVHLSNVMNSKKQATLGWTDLQKLFSRLNESDQESWCVETDPGTTKKELTPEIFLAPKRTHHRAYCSFLVQKDQEAYTQTESSLPVIELPGVAWSYESALWIFFGRNPPGNKDLPGRPDHTDSISADGTWHFQLSGTKKWIIRPSEELLQHMSRTLNPSDFRNWGTSSTVEINCRQGDVLVINTRLWFHQTHIPAQYNPSVSYARDFWRKPSADVSGSMCNVDGLYATNDIEEGVIVFTQDTMPDCSLHRSDNPNCEIVKTEEGQLAIVSARDIKSGEFFCLANSDDDGSEGEEEQEEEDQDEE